MRGKELNSQKHEDKKFDHQHTKIVQEAETDAEAPGRIQNTTPEGSLLSSSINSTAVEKVKVP